MEQLSLPVKFIDEYLPKADPVYVVVYLYIYRFLSDGKSAPKAEEVSAALGIKESDVRAAVLYWSERGFRLGEEKLARALHKSVYTPAEIARQAQEDPQLRWLYDEAQALLSKVLSSGDMQALFWMYDYLGHSPQVILLMLNHAIRQGKGSTMRFVEKIAMRWSDEGIDTVKKAEEHLARLEERSGYEYHVKKLLGIRDRALTPSETTVLRQWDEAGERPSDELLMKAFDIAVQRTGKLSLCYINGILKSWAEKGIKTPGDISREMPPAKKSKSANFSQREDIDFDARELEMLKKRVGRQES